MNVSLTAELEKFIHSKVASGYFQNASEVVRSALRLMREKETEREHQLSWLQREVDRGWEEAQSGKLIEVSKVKTQMAGFKKKWKTARSKEAK
jgi:antitoxin ParD1/3/4